MYTRIVIFILALFDNINKRKVINFFKKNLKKEIHVFIDVGSHHAETIKLFNKNFIVKKFFGFEASPINFQILKKKINNINNSSIEIFNYAIGEKVGIFEFNQFYESSSSTLVKINDSSKYLIKKNKVLNFFKNKSTPFKTFKVEVKTLKDFIENKAINNVEILKIDTEGYDFSVIKSLGDKIQNVEYIYFEHHFHDMLQKNYHLSDIHTYLKNYNFEKVFKIKMYFRKTFEYIYRNKLILKDL